MDTKVWYRPEIGTGLYLHRRARAQYLALGIEDMVSSVSVSGCVRILSFLCVVFWYF